MKAFVVILLALLTLPAYADELRVIIVVPAGSTQLEYRLNENDSRSFWQRWSKLPRSEQMVPLSSGGNYAGLNIRSQNKQVRLFNGIGTYDIESRTDNLRILERWVLSKAPPPYGPALLAELDRAIDNMAIEQKVTNPKPDELNTILLKCNARGTKNQELRARCLEDALHERVDWHGYANLLEQALRSTEAKKN